MSVRIAAHKRYVYLLHRSRKDRAGAHLNHIREDPEQSGPGLSYDQFPSSSAGTTSVTSPGVKAGGRGAPVSVAADAPKKRRQHRSRGCADDKLKRRAMARAVVGADQSTRDKMGLKLAG